MVDHPEKLGVYGRLSASGRAIVVPTPAIIVKTFMRVLLFPFGEDAVPKLGCSRARWRISVRV